MLGRRRGPTSSRPCAAGARPRRLKAWSEDEDDVPLPSARDEFSAFPRRPAADRFPAARLRSIRRGNLCRPGSAMRDASSHKMDSKDATKTA